MITTVAPLRIPKVRWGIGVLLGTGVLVNYLDRINLSVGGPQLQQEFGLSAGELGWLQIPTGMILDRFGVTLVNRLSTFLWSVASTATTFDSGFGGILAARVLLGAAEAPSSRQAQRPPVIGSPARNARSRHRSSMPPQSSPT